MGSGVSVGDGEAVDVGAAEIAGGGFTDVREGEAVCPEGFGAQEDVKTRMMKSGLMFILELYTMALMPLCFSSHW